MQSPSFSYDDSTFIEQRLERITHKPTKHDAVQHEHLLPIIGQFAPQMTNHHYSSFSLTDVTRRKRQRTRCHLNESDRAGIQLKAPFRLLIHKHAGDQRIERHLRQRVEAVNQNGAENVAVLQNRRVTRVLVVLQEKLLVGVVAFERVLAENAAELALQLRIDDDSYLHVVFATSRRFHLLGRKRLGRPEEEEEEGEDVHGGHQGKGD